MNHMNRNRSQKTANEGILERSVEVLGSAFVSLAKEVAIVAVAPPKQVGRKTSMKTTLRFAKASGGKES